MTTQKQDMKKKRRSFYEPDSEAIRQWLDNQKDFGRTLQLLAVDAMAKYGTGDAIEGMLHLRTQEPQALQATPVQVVEQAVHTPQQAPAPVQPTPQYAPQPTVAPQVQVQATPAPAPQAHAVPVTPVPANTEQAPQAGLDAIDALFK